MVLALFFLAFSLFWKISSTKIQCYQCYAELPYIGAEYNRNCAHFNRSAMYAIQCQNSSMCYKKETTLDFGNGLTSISYYRGCALQTENGAQKRINGTWKRVYDIHDVYNEGCKPDGTYADRITKTLHCYCSGDLCNAASRTLTCTTSLLFIVTYVFNFIVTFVMN